MVACGPVVEHYEAEDVGFGVLNWQGGAVWDGLGDVEAHFEFVVEFTCGAVGGGAVWAGSEGDVFGAGDAGWGWEDGGGARVVD